MTSTRACTKFHRNKGGGAWTFAQTAKDCGKAIGHGSGNVGTTIGRRSGQTVSNDDSSLSLDSAGYESSSGIRFRAHET